MNYKKISFAALVLTAALAIAGCVSAPELKNEDVNNCSGCEKSLQEKDQQIIKLQELVDDQQGQLKELNGQLKSCRKELKAQPNLK